MSVKAGQLQSYTPLVAESGAVDGFISVGQDITAHRQEQHRLLQLSERDALTGLFNRAGFDRRLETEFAQGRGAELAMLYVDLDHFKPVNDRHGHPVGDRLLQLVAQRLLSLVRPTDVVARLGGDEFALLLSGVRNASNAAAVADKVVGAAAKPFVVDDLSLQIGASVGVAFGIDPAAGAGDLIARADAMLYRAKRSGKGVWAGEPG
ncbi:diguanylate cyclase domain-containing protein [Piscinibacter sakaiensis]|uniref:diguanylate cyclase domain-containing protein n=1 Tax=Piscinibacter sakaiensis TaxID=1547922 RepID=UPI003AADEA40